MTRKITRKEKARNDLAMSVYNLCWKLALRGLQPGEDADDAFQEGFLGAMRAAEKYDGRGAFTTYANRWIRMKIGEHRNGDTLVMLPENVAAALRTYRKTAWRLMGAIGREPTFDEIADAMKMPGVNRETFRQGVAASQAECLTILPGEALSRELSPPERAEQDELRDMIRTALRRLPPRWRAVVRMRFGLDGSPPRDFREIGEDLGCSYQRAQNILNMATERLRPILEAKGLAA